ncbi:hypothetical protein KY290_038352 [Solanum tuberosum]|uniref:FAR1 domain-containing protein n=1 Tax=Solanum tuberosum TaxID=4113 RepID=A0ABQ7TY58_SOLTU|nr:hypothetical protein KY289_036261 [Solanum tuberosum]KAH0639512.1 hypothetical protein KY285_036098 [Solanum tuberosum]KAH0739647.1 hypothetical protein KY290_038352 [Solanum tuberosum]
MKNHYGPPRKARTSRREGCKAMMLVEVNKFDKLAVTRFVKEHTHPLVPSGCSSGNAMDKKDRRIQELSMELERQDKLRDLYREQLVTFLENVEQQIELLSKKIQVAVNNIKEVEAELKQQLSCSRTSNCRMMHPAENGRLSNCSSISYGASDRFGDS